MEKDHRRVLRECGKRDKEDRVLTIHFVKIGLQCTLISNNKDIGQFFENEGVLIVEWIGFYAVIRLPMLYTASVGHRGRCQAPSQHVLHDTHCVSFTVQLSAELFNDIVATDQKTVAIDLQLAGIGISVQRIVD